MKVLIISANFLPASPTGPAYVAGAALLAGHTVEVFECLFAQDVAGELIQHIQRFQPDVIGVSIRLVHGYIIDPSARYNTRHLDLRKDVLWVVNAIRQATSAPIILGGPGFNYYAADWLEYLDLDYGIRGEAEFSFPLYLERLATGGDLTSIPGAVFRVDGQICKTPRDQVQNLNQTAMPAYQLFDLEKYRELGVSPGIMTKRGCAFLCTYCPYRSLEGKTYRMKSPARVLTEIAQVQQGSEQLIMFCENNFNSPRHHAEAICREILAQKMKVRWGTGDLRPLGISEDFCQLLRDSGCAYVNLSIESASDAMLQRMQRGYTRADVLESLETLEKTGIPYSVSLMIGAPGETPQTVAESVDILNRHSIPLGSWMTIGVCLWTPRQEVLAEARQNGQLTNDRMLFEGINYLSPELPRDYMEELIGNLRNRKGLSVQVNQPYAGFQWPSVSEEN